MFWSKILFDLASDGEKHIACNNNMASGIWVHTCTKQSWKNKRRIEAGSRESLALACLIALRTTV